MQKIHDWAARWGVSSAALTDLLTVFGAVNTDPKPSNFKNEAEVQAAVRIEATEKGGRLWRNNLGATFDTRGNFIRYGLCNDSKKLNEKIKSSDLIGLKPINIDGTIVGQFIAREVKRPGWTYTGTAAEEAQLRFLQLVTSLGGDASFTTNIGTL